MTEKQKRMKEIVVRMQHYVSTYSDQALYQDYSDKTFILDMLYGIGMSMDQKYCFSNGFEKFKKDYKKLLTNGN